MRFSSDALPARDRFDVWRDLIGRKLFRMSIDPIGEAPYRAKAALRALPSLKIGIGSVSAAIHHHTREIALAENDDVLLVVNLRGSLLVRRASTDLVLGPGDGLIVECREPGIYVMSGPGRHLAVRLSPGVLGAFSRHVGRAFGRVIPAPTEALKLLAGYARTLPQGEWELSPAATQVVTDHIGDLLALIVGAGGDTAAVARQRGLAAARLGAVKTVIRERIGHFDLTAHAVAQDQGISPRYLRQLFEAEDQNFSGYVLEQRLGQAHAMITSRRFASESISKIAFEVGFGDLSYFNRSFRRRFERTPREARAEAIRAWAEEDQRGDGGSELVARRR
ncbi:MAG TPA: AraC family transcriptional regulator [Caulobacteraceae bacterium]|jgi:AraC-like DNA-binding protein|nr:AraC family transcriptional regulator [Caulobacteraceae bacterium]